MTTDHWTSLYRSRYNYLLHSALRTRYHRLQLTASILAALTASGSLAATFGEHSWIWQTLIALSAIFAIIGPVLRWSDLESLHSGLAMGYRALEWRLPKLTEEQAHEELAKLEAQETHAEPIRWHHLQKDADQRTRQQLKVS